MPDAPSSPPPAADGALQALLADVEQFTDALTQRSASARLTRAQAQAVYALAYQLVAQGQFDKAYEYFALLTLYYPTDAAYLAGLALCYRMLGRYEQAINVYAFLATLQAQEPAHSVSISECLMLQGAFEQALQTLQLVLRYCREHSGFDKVAQRAQALAQLLKPGMAPA
mgnify:CR=1 FL=1